MTVAATAATAAVVGAPAAAAPAAAAAAMIARYDFDGRSSILLDDTGRGHKLHMVTARGGAARTVVRGGGQGLQFPAKCAGSRCPTAVLQSPHSADLNPGARPLAFGAAVRLSPHQTSGGQNVVQKGYSATSSQYKLQIDGRAGRPSCVLVDERKPGIRQVTSTVSVADGQWHTVQCRRAGAALRVLVDGVVRGLAKVPAGLSVANRHPLSIGGKGAYIDNDQYHGAVDDVWVRIG